MAATLDTLRYSQRLQQSGVSRDQADTHAELARDMVMAELVTKDDLKTALIATKSELLAAMREMELRMTIKLGAMIAASVGLVLAGLRFF